MMTILPSHMYYIFPHRFSHEPQTCRQPVGTLREPPPPSSPRHRPPSRLVLTHLGCAAPAGASLTHTHRATASRRGPAEQRPCVTKPHQPPPLPPAGSRYVSLPVTVSHLGLVTTWPRRRTRIAEGARGRGRGRGRGGTRKHSRSILARSMQSSGHQPYRT